MINDRRQKLLKISKRLFHDYLIKRAIQAKMITCVRELRETFVISPSQKRERIFKTRNQAGVGKVKSVQKISCVRNSTFRQKRQSSYETKPMIVKRLHKILNNPRGVNG